MKEVKNMLKLSKGKIALLVTFVMLVACALSVMGLTGVLPSVGISSNEDVVENRDSLAYVEFVLVGYGLYERVGLTEIVMYTLDLLGENFNNDMHGTQFPTVAEVRTASEYYLWSNEFGHGFQEWNFNGQWRVGSPVIGKLIDLNNFNLEATEQTIRVYAYFEQLLIECNATLREALNRTTVGVPAKLVIQNSFAMVGAAINITAGRDIAIEGRFANDSTITQTATNQRHFIANGILRLKNIALSGNNEYIATNHGGVTVNAGGHLFMEDGGIIQNNRAANGGGVLVTGVNARLTINDGTIENNNTTGHGGGVYVHSGAQFVMNDGVIRNNVGRLAGGVSININNSTQMYMAGGEIYGNTGNLGGGVNVEVGTFTMIGGVIRNNTATALGNPPATTLAANRGGGGVFVQNNGTFNMEGGEIRNNNSGLHGSGVHVLTGTFNMRDGEISGNTAASNGGGVAVQNGNWFTMYGGTITGNTATNVGGGIWLGAANARLNAVGGEITFNEATFGGGVYVLAENMSRSSIGEDVIFTGNTATAGALVNNQFAMNNPQIAPGTTSLRWWDTFPEDEPQTNAFHHAFNNYDISVRVGQVPVVGDYDITVSSWAQLRAAVNAAISGDVIIATQNIYADLNAVGNAIVIPKGLDITITSENRYVLTQQNTNQRHFILYGTLRLENVVVSGNYPDITTNHGGITVNTGAHLIIEDGGVIANNRAANGGGIYVTGEETLVTMNGGILEGNSASRYGGGIYISNGTLFVMNNGIIRNNTARFGGGITLNTDIATKMYMFNGEIYGNVAQRGGAVNIEYGTFTMIDGEIHSNTATGFVEVASIERR